MTDARPPSSSRFLLLHLSLSAGAMFAAVYVTVVRDVWREPNLACVRGASGEAGSRAAVESLVRCTDRLAWWQIGVTASAPVALGVLTLLAARVAPSWLTWRHGITSHRPDPAVAAVLAQLVADAGLRREPLWCKAKGVRGESFTYGSPPRVVLGGQVYRALRRGHGTAVVRHELGHVVNRDIGRTYRAVLALGVFTVVVAVPLGFAARTTSGFGGRFALLAAVGVLVWLAVLRTREHEADRTAATWDHDGITTALTAVRPARSRMPWWLRTHPTPDRRLAALGRPPRLHPWECFATGLTAAVVLVEVTAVPVGAFALEVAAVIAGILVAIPIVMIVGLGVWRRPPGSVVACSTATGAGLVVGTQLSPRGGPPLRSVSFSGAGAESVSALGSMHPWTAALVVGLPFVTCLVVFGWFALTARRATRSAAVVGVAAVGVALGGWSLLIALAGSSRGPAELFGDRAVPPFPASRQAGLACAWLGASGRAAFDRPGLGAYLERTDDPLIRHVGHVLPTDPATARTALTRRCSLLIRYGRHP